MKIRIRDNAKSVYLGRINCQGGCTNWDWAYLLEVLQGEVLEVQTEYLFVDQFNAAPPAPERAEELMARLNPRHSEQVRASVKKVLTGTGMRIMEYLVSEVMDDVRPNKMRCHWCGHCADLADSCPKCGKDDHLSPLGRAA